MEAVDAMLARWLTADGVRMWWDWPREEWAGLTPREMWGEHDYHGHVMRLARAGLGGS